MPSRMSKSVTPRMGRDVRFRARGHAARPRPFTRCGDRDRNWSEASFLLIPSQSWLGGGEALSRTLQFADHGSLTPP